MAELQFPRVIDSSIRKEWRLCQTRAKYSYFRGITPVGGSIHLHFGGCFARGLESVRKAYYGEGLPVLESIAKGAHDLIIAWGSYESVLEGNKSLSSCLVALSEYFIQYPLAEDQVKPLMLADGSPAVEFTFAIPIPNTVHPDTGEPILYGGRCDMLAQYGKAVWVEDDKTTSQLGASWAKQWKLASQLTGYVFAAKSFGYPVMGAIIRGVGILKNTITHQMCMESRPQWMLDRWWEQLQLDVAEMVVAYKSDSWRLDLDHSCGTYGGCPFLQLCTSPDPESWIDTNYEVKRWNPIAKLEPAA